MSDDAEKQPKSPTTGQFSNAEKEAERIRKDHPEFFVKEDK